jgi:hypothetical protein
MEDKYIFILLWWNELFGIWDMQGWSEYILSVSYFSWSWFQYFLNELNETIHYVLRQTRLTIACLF